MPRNNQRTDVSRQELQRLEARLTSLAGRTARQTGDSDELPVDAVDTVNIANDAVTEDKIADGAVTFKKLASGGTTSGGGGNYSSQAETRRSGATATTEIYYTARPDGDGYAESEVSDAGLGAGESSRRRLYYSDKFDADPDTSGDWTLYTTQPADDTAFATCKASLLAGLSDTDGTANTRGTLPVSLKMERTVVTPLLLDTYTGAAAAYSVRKIRDGYTGNAIRIREDSGNTETDIGFDSNGDLDTAAIASHCGANNGYVVTWYDQSGNGNDATQSTTTQQPHIYNGTTTISENGQPAMEFDGSNDKLEATYTDAIDYHGIFLVVSYDSTGDINSTLSIFRSSLSKGDLLIRDNNYFVRFFASNTDVDRCSLTETTSQQLIAALWDGVVPANSGTLPPDGTLSTYQDGALTDDSAADDNFGLTGAGIAIGADPANFYLNGKMQECIFWDSDQSTNRTGIESDIDTYYQPTTQLLLDTYGGAAAAYSVRKLSQWYTGNCMKVRRDSDDTTQDIGFDSNGDLDTAAIKTFCDDGGAGTLGYVDTWYDQSGNSNDATQATTTQQPQIYDGTAVITAGNIPALDPLGASVMATGRNYAQPFSSYVVGETPTTGAGYIHSGGNEQGILYSSKASTRLGIYAGTWLDDNSYTPADRSLFASVFNGSSSTLHENGSLVVSGNAGTNSTIPMNLFARRPGGTMTVVRVSEMIFYDSDHSANRTGVEYNINTYFSIY